MTLKKLYKLIRSRLFEKKIHINKDKEVTERYPDLELELELELTCENSIMYIDDLQILENYVSFMEIVNYLSSPLEERDQHHIFSFVIKDKNKLKDYKVNMVYPL
jgi:hypothetical protein